MTPKMVTMWGGVLPRKERPRRMETGRRRRGGRLDALRLQGQRVQTLAADDLILEIAADRARRQVGVVVLSTTATLKEDAFRMKLRRESIPFKQVTKEIDTALDQLARERKSLTSEAAVPELPDPSLAWEDLSAEDRRALPRCWSTRSSSLHIPTRSSTASAIPHPRHSVPSPSKRLSGLKAVHEARVKIVPRV